MSKPVDVIISGNALNSFGFIGENFTVEGLGLNSFGFLWPCSGIWVDSYTSVSTTWTDCATGATGPSVCVD